jgi:hypothetical protein
VAEKEKKTGNGMKAALLASAMLATASVALYFGTAAHAVKAGGPEPSSQETMASTSSAKTISLPLFFEPNQGQTAPQVKFLARGAGYGLFLTADEAVLNLRRLSSAPRTATVPRPASSSVIRMKLEGANSAARVSGAEPLPGKSNYFIGNDPSKWRQNIPQYAHVEYKSVYPGVDLVYYGDQGQLEYDFQVAPGAEPSQIALSFQGASTRIESGDLMLSTDQGEVRFQAPRVYQQDGSARKTVAGSFRQLADNKIGFTIGEYDHSRELVIDPVLSYSTYIGGSNGIESFVNVAVDSAGFIYLAGATTSNDFPLATAPPAPLQPTLAGAQNIFIAVINPSPQPGNPQLIYATYLGGSGTDFPAGIALSTNLDQFTTGIDIYVAGTTSSANFPVSTTASGGLAPFQAGPPTDPGNHGFVTRLNVPTFGTQGTSTTLRYSTYLAGTNAAGTATDTVTGLAIDTAGNAFVTGVTTSTNDTSVGFPANPNAFQIKSNAPSQFFASEINTKGSGPLSMIYSTYLGGGNSAGGNPTQGGGIAIDASDNMYITGGTNFLPTIGPNGEAAFPLNAAFQSCLDESGQTGCTASSTPTKLDAFVAKITPKPGLTLPVYCTYLGGSDDDIGFGIAVDSSGNAYITGSTFSSDWTSTGSGFQTSYGGSGDAFIAKIGNLTGSIFPLTYFTYLGGSGVDVGHAIQVDSVQAVHVAGSTTSTAPSFPITTNTLQAQNGGGEDAFVAVIGTTLSGKGAGDIVTFLGGTGTDQGTGVVVDPVFGATYVAGSTTSADFPTKNPYQDHLNGSQNAFVSKIGASSTLTVTPSTTSPSPNPVAAGAQVAFTFNIGNNPGSDTASQIVFTAGNLPTSGLATTPTAKVTSGTGSCNPVQGSTITCFIPTLAVCSTTPCTSATVEVDVTPSITAITTGLTQIQVSGQATANNNGIVFVSNPPQTPANIVDFTVTAAAPNPNPINAGDTAAIQVAFCPSTTHGYNATITPSQTASPSIVTATAPTFTPSSVTLSGSSCGTTTLRIPTVPRPVTTGRLLRHGLFYAVWLPIGGLSLVSLGIGASSKRRRWLAAVVLGLIVGAILLQSGCGSSSRSVTPGGGTQAGTYTITISGSAGTGASHNTTATLFVR